MPHVVAVLVLVALVMGAPRLPASATEGSTCLLLCLLPLLAAPFMGAPSFIAVDIALIASALLALVMIAKPTSSLGVARAPLALILGWLMVMSATHGAWIPAIASLLIYAASLAYSFARPHHGEVIHAA